MRWIAWVGLLATTGLLASTAPTASAGRATPAQDLRSVDWSSVTLPPVCGGTKPIRMHHPSWAFGRTERIEGTASVSPIPRRWAQDWFYGRHSVEVDTGWNHVVYGDLSGHGQVDAGLVFNCNNGGGTADGVLLEGWVIFTGGAGKLSVVGVVTPRVQPTGELPTLVEIAIQPGKIIAHEFFYGPSDGTCCASGRATTVWSYARGLLRPGTPTITRRPVASSQ